MTKLASFAFCGATIAIVLAINYGLALVGEPRSHWLFCTLLGAC